MDISPNEAPAPLGAIELYGERRVNRTLRAPKAGCIIVGKSRRNAAIA